MKLYTEKLFSLFRYEGLRNRANGYEISPCPCEILVRTTTILILCSYTTRLHYILYTGRRRIFITPPCTTGISGFRYRRQRGAFEKLVLKDRGRGPIEIPCKRRTARNSCARSDYNNASRVIVARRFEFRIRATDRTLSRLINVLSISKRKMNDFHLVRPPPVRVKSCRVSRA